MSTGNSVLFRLKPLWFKLSFFALWALTLAAAITWLGSMVINSTVAAPAAIVAILSCIALLLLLKFGDR